MAFGHKGEKLAGKCRVSGHYFEPCPPFQVIQEQPPRTQSLEKIAELERKLRTLVAKRKTLKLKLELRKKQFHLLVQCVHQLQDSLQRVDGYGLEWEGEGGDSVAGDIQEVSEDSMELEDIL